MSRVINAATAVLSVRFLLESLGPERFAAHVLIVASASWFLLSDLGLRNAAQNEISRRIAVGRSYQDVIAGAGLGLLVLAPLTWAMLVLAGPALTATYLRGVLVPQEELHRAFLLAGALGLTSSVCNLAFNVWYAERRGHRANYVSSLSAVGSLGAVALLSGSDLDRPLQPQIWAVLGVPAALAVLSAAALVVRAPFLGARDRSCLWCQEFSIRNMAETVRLTVIARKRFETRFA